MDNSHQAGEYLNGRCRLGYKTRHIALYFFHALLADSDGTSIQKAMASGESRELKNNAILCYQRTASVWTERNVAFRSSLSLVVSK